MPRGHNRKNKKRNKRSPHKRGLKIGCINVNGLVNSPTKRIDLNNWIKLHNLDVVCIQEWYVINKKDIKDNNNNNNENDEMIQEDFGLEPLSISLDMSAFTDYLKIEHDNKTLILYKLDLKITTFNHFDKISQNGLDISWIGVETHRKVIVIGSCYHSPNYKCTYDQISIQKNRIKRELKKKKKKTIFMINGDFNSKHTIWGSTEIDNRGEYLLDWLGENRMSFLNNGDYTYTKPDGTKEVLDLMVMDMVEQNLVSNWSCHSVFSTRKRVTRFGTKTIQFSDHRGMICTLNLDPNYNERPDKICWNLDESKKEKFRDEIKIQMKIWYNEYENHKNDRLYLDKLVEYFQLLITTTAQRIFGFKKYNNQSVNWVDQKVYDILAEKKKVKNKISHLIHQMKKHFGQVKFAPLTMKRKLKRIKHRRNKLNKKMKKYKYENMLKSTRKLENLINNPNVNKEKLFYDAVKKISNNTTISIPPLRNPKTDEIIATSDAEIADELHKFYCTPPTRNPYEPKHIAYHNHVDNFVLNYPNNRNNSDNIVNREFTEQEVLYVINNLNLNSSMAFDFVHYQLLHWAKLEIVSNLTNLFNMCYYIHQKCPKIWKYGEFVPVPKPGRVPYYCKNIRPITILPGLGRVLGKLLCNRILTDCIERKILTKNNCAFQRNKSPNDIVNNFAEKIYQAFQNGHFMELDILDLKSAYDSVVANELIYRMINEFGFDGNIIAWYQDFLRNRKTRVKYNKSTTVWRDSLENLPQGQTDSTILFDLMINYVNLTDVDKIAKDLKKIDDMIKMEEMNGNQDQNEMKNGNEEKLDEHSDSEEEKAEILDFNVKTSGQNSKRNKIYVPSDMTNKDLHIRIRRELHKDIDWNNIVFNPNLINKDDKTLKIKQFQIELKNFADDCTLEMNPILEKSQLTNYIKYGYRLNLQHSLNQFYNRTRYKRLVLSQAKCNTITFSRKRQQFHAYVYKLGTQKLELVHSHDNGPQYCKHNARLNYVEANFDPKEGNGDSDLDNLDENGNKIKTNTNFKSSHPKNPICTIQKTGKMANKQKKSFIQLPPNVRILGVFLDPELYFNEHIRIVRRKAEIKLHGLLKLAFCKHFQG